jgi:hypothetical protein
MVQVGTAAYDAEAWCHPTTVTLAGTELPEGVDAAVSTFSDGYQLTMAVTVGGAVATEGAAGMCIMGEATGAVCVGALAGDEDETMAANGLKSKMYAAGTFKPEADNDAAAMVDLPAGAWAVLAPAGVNNAKAVPAAEPKEGEEAEEAAEPKEGEQLAGGLKEGAVFSVVYYQPKMAKTYAGLWRFNAKDSVTGYAHGPTADDMKTNKKCMTAELTGASALVAGAAIAFGAAALF